VVLLLLTPQNMKNQDLHHCRSALVALLPLPLLLMLLALLALLTRQSAHHI